MTETTYYIVGGSHPVSLASGRSVAPNELVSSDNLTLKIDPETGGTDTDERLLEEHVLLEVSGRPDTPPPLASLDEHALAQRVADSTIDALLTEVGDDADLAQRVLDAERSRGDAARSSLVEKLHALASHDQENK